jgi:hypothetical protein
MKYNQPFDQPSSPNAPYVDGNPSAGIQGSIVPAASIEYPQREIVNAIAAAGLLPSNGDLSQLLEMIKIADVFNHFKFGVNQGSATQWSTAIPSLPIMPPPDGTAIWFRPGYPSTPAGAVFSVNGSPFAPVVHPDLSPVTEGDIIPTGWVLLLYYQGNWQIANAGGASTRQTGALPMLTKNADWYVNDAIGNDTDYDGTSPTVLSAKVGPFKTIQRAANEVLKYNMNNYAQFIHVADGNYHGMTYFRPQNGTGWIYVVGNPTSPQNVNVVHDAATGVNQGCTFFQMGGYYDFDGFRFANTHPTGLDGWASNGGVSYLHNLRFGPCTRFHMSAGDSGCTVGFQGPSTITIEAGANAVSHISSTLVGYMTFPVALGAGYWPSLNILGAVAFQSFAHAGELGLLQMRYAAITGGGFVSGQSYTSIMNGILESVGGGADYYPHSLPGSVATGGQYGA